MDKDYNREIEGKLKNDYFRNPPQNMSRIIEVKGPVIVGAGPSGLATAACLKHGGVDSLIIERADCIASLWQKKTYDRLHLHLPKHFCELPLMPFPSHFPVYPTKQQFISYLETYATSFGLKPVFNSTVIGAEFDYGSGFWRIMSKGMNDDSEVVIEYLCKWLIVATGENAEEFVPNIEGMDIFKGSVIHTSCYRSGDCFRGKSVLVVGCGNSGMEVSLDLCNYNVRTSLVVRNTVHVLPQEMLGRSTFGLSMELLKWLPVRIVDQFLLLMSRFILGNTSELGLNRPKLGPLQLKSISGKTPVLDVGTISNIRAGKIKVVRGIKRLMSNSVEFVDGMVENFDAIILATGYTSNVPSWLKENSLFSKKNGLPCKPFPEGWKGGNGLYAVGFNKRGLYGTSMEAIKIAEDIQNQYNSNNKVLIKSHQFQEPSFQLKNLESFLPT